MSENKGAEGMKRMMLPSVFDPGVLKRTRLDIQYGSLPEQLLDVYYPDEGEGPWPLIIYVHGGGWSMGSRRECAIDCILGALKRGYALVTLDYRLAPKTKFPEFLFDVKTAVRWCRANAKEYGFIPDKFGVMGDSAGGHLALMIGFTAGHPEYEGEQYGWPGVSSAVQAVIDMYGPAVLDADNFAWTRENGLKSMRPEPPKDAPPMLAGAFTADLNMLKLISPISYVHKDIPPVLIQQGEADPVVPKQHSILVAERIRQVCGPDRVDLRLYPGRSHSDHEFMTEANCAEACEFFDKYLK